MTPRAVVHEACVPTANADHEPSRRCKRQEKAYGAVARIGGFWRECQDCEARRFEAGLKPKLRSSSRRAAVRGPVIPGPHRARACPDCSSLPAARQSDEAGRATTNPAVSRRAFWGSLLVCLTGYRIRRKGKTCALKRSPPPGFGVMHNSRKDERKDNA